MLAQYYDIIDEAREEYVHYVMGPQQGLNDQVQRSQ